MFKGGASVPQRMGERGLNYFTVIIKHTTLNTSRWNVIFKWKSRALPPFPSQCSFTLVPHLTFDTWTELVGFFVWSLLWSVKMKKQLVTHEVINWGLLKLKDLHIQRFPSIILVPFLLLLKCPTSNWRAVCLTGFTVRFLTSPFCVVPFLCTFSVHQRPKFSSRSFVFVLSCWLTSMECCLCQARG